MNEQLIEEVLEELRPALAGRPWGKVFQLSANTLAVDFRTGDGRYLLLSADPARPRLHMVARTVRALERASLAPMPFALFLRKALGGATLRALTKDEGERVVRFEFTVPDALGVEGEATLVAQLTGRSANLLLLDERGRVRMTLRPTRGAGQTEGEVYGPPGQSPAAAPLDVETTRRRAGPDLSREGAASLSEALDRYHLRQEAERAFDARANAAAARLRQQLANLRKLRDNLRRDLEGHGDAEAHKRAGDLLLANIGTAVRAGGRVLVTDFYAEDTPTVELEVDENRTLQEEAAQRFARYTKAKRAAREIAERLVKVEPELAALEARRAELEGIVAARDEAGLAAFDGGKADEKAGDKRPGGVEREKGSKKSSAEKGRTLRRYRSSDGYEVVVGRGARENDELTFRVARSYDTWMHAADYPGSHVVVRARGKDDAIPHRTLVEAARLAAHFSQARKDAKVAVNYTQRKFVSKPRGAAPGLVYLSSFRTLLVEPAEELERI
jgi:predicted ribosome quality control (RQC) complex YloA/Tae2 family protein